MLLAGDLESAEQEGDYAADQDRDRHLAEPATVAEQARHTGRVTGRRLRELLSGEHGQQRTACSTLSRRRGAAAARVETQAAATPSSGGGGRDHERWDQRVEIGVALCAERRAEDLLYAAR